MGHVARKRREEGSLNGKRQPERSRHKLEDRIKMDLQVVGCVGMDWIDLAQDGARGRHL